MDDFLTLLPVWTVRLAWPFLRILTALVVAPVLGDLRIPMRARVATALILAVTAAPTLQAIPDVDPFAARGVALAAQQILIGALFGLMFHLVLTAFTMGGFLIASQFGFAMAVMNDPQNGTSANLMSTLLYVLFTLLFFATDSHLLVVQVVYASLRAWPVGGAFQAAPLLDCARLVAWTFSTAVMLALPTMFASLIVQIGMGLIGRAVPSLNVYSLAFSLSIVVGFYALGHLVPAVPGYYLRLTARLLGQLGREFGAAHG